ncbi:MAG: hypothetical protein VX522_04830, partial [Actinomycetota bacterium]|nr:hypothetical protein [Actinomycetota bacterium]
PASAAEEPAGAAGLASQSGPGDDAFAGAYEADVIVLAGSMDLPTGDADLSSDEGGDAVPEGD